MAIVIDASSPAGVTTTTTSCVTASFTPAANSLIVALGAANNNVGGVTPTGAVTDSLGSTWTRIARQNASGLGCAEIYMLDAGASPAARTVTMTSSTTKGAMVTVLVLTGAATLAGQTATPVAQGTTAMQAAITTTQVGSLVVGAEDYAFTSTTLTLNASTTLTFQARDATNSGTYSAIRATATTVTPGSITIGFTDTGFGNVEMALLEVLPTAAAVVPSIGLAPSRDYYPGDGPRRVAGTRFNATYFSTDTVAPDLGSWLPGLTIPRRSVRKIPGFRTNSGTDVPESLLPPSAIKRATPGRRQYVPARVDGDSFSPPFTQPTPVNPAITQTITGRVRRLGQVLRRSSSAPEPVPAQVAPAAPSWVPGLRVARRLGRNRSRAVLSAPVTAQDVAPGTTRRPRPVVPSRRLRGSKSTAPQAAPVPLVARLRIIARTVRRPIIATPTRAQQNPPIVQTVFGRLRTVGRIQPRAKVRTPVQAQQAATPNPTITQTVFGRLRTVGRTSRVPRIVKPVPAQVNPPIVQTVFGRLRIVGRIQPRAKTSNPTPTQPTVISPSHARPLGRVKPRNRLSTPIPVQQFINPNIVQTVFGRLRTIGRIQPRARVNDPTPAQQSAVANPRTTQTMFGRLRLSGRTNRIPRVVKPIPGQVNPPYPVKPSRVVAFRGTSRRRGGPVSTPQVQPTAETRAIPASGLRGLRRLWLKIRRKNATPVPAQVTTLQGPLIITDSYGGTEADRSSNTLVGGTYGSTGSATVGKSSSGGFSADPDNDNVTGTYDSDSDSL